MVDDWYDNGKITNNFLQKKWVTLEKAQKDKQDLKDKINKILDEPHVKLIKHPDIERLREVLKVE